MNITKEQVEEDIRQYCDLSQHFLDNVKYIAVDCSGSVYVYRSRPEMNIRMCMWQTTNPMEYNFLCTLNNEENIDNWKECVFNFVPTVTKDGKKSFKLAYISTPGRDFKKELKEAEYNASVAWYKDEPIRDYARWTGWVGKDELFQIWKLDQKYHISLKFMSDWTNTLNEYTTLSSAKRAVNNFVKKIRLLED